MPAQVIAFMLLQQSFQRLEITNFNDYIFAIVIRGTPSRFINAVFMI